MASMPRTSQLHYCSATRTRTLGVRVRLMATKDRPLVFTYDQFRGLLCKSTDNSRETAKGRRCLKKFKCSLTSWYSIRDKSRGSQWSRVTNSRACPPSLPWPEAVPEQERTDSESDEGSRKVWLVSRSTDGAVDREDWMTRGTIKLDKWIAKRTMAQRRMEQCRPSPSWVCSGPPTAR